MFILEYSAAHYLSLQNGTSFAITHIYSSLSRKKLDFTCNSMEESNSCKANSFWASQDISSAVRNPKI
jgi:hypothetical protein